MNEAPNSWYWSFRLAVEHGYIDLHNETELAGACLRDPPDDFITGGLGINGTDDGGNVMIYHIIPHPIPYL